MKLSAHIHQQGSSTKTIMEIVGSDWDWFLQGGVWGDIFRGSQAQKDGYFCSTNTNQTVYPLIANFSLFNCLLPRLYVIANCGPLSGWPCGGPCAAASFQNNFNSKFSSRVNLKRRISSRYVTESLFRKYNWVKLQSASNFLEITPMSPQTS